MFACRVVLCFATNARRLTRRTRVKAEPLSDARGNTGRRLKQLRQRLKTISHASEPDESSRLLSERKMRRNRKWSHVCAFPVLLDEYPRVCNESE